MHNGSHDEHAGAGVNVTGWTLSVADGFFVRRCRSVDAPDEDIATFRENKLYRPEIAFTRRRHRLGDEVSCELHLLRRGCAQGEAGAVTPVPAEKEMMIGIDAGLGHGAERTNVEG